MDQSLIEVQHQGIPWFSLSTLKRGQERWWNLWQVREIVRKDGFLGCSNRWGFQDGEWILTSESWAARATSNQVVSARALVTILNHSIGHSTSFLTLLLIFTRPTPWAGGRWVGASQSAFLRWSIHFDLWLQKSIKFELFNVVEGVSYLFIWEKR